MLWGVFWNPIGAPEEWVPKNGTAQVDAKELSWRLCKVYIFPTYFEDFVLLRPLTAHPFVAYNFQNMQKSIGFIDVSVALTEAMLDHPSEHQKPKNERHAPWERSGAKKKTSATLHRSVPAKKWSPEKGPKKTLQSI